jgi:hypothetical protein
MVPVYYEAVNFPGHLFYVGSRNPFDCLSEPAYDVAVCLAGYTSIGMGIELYDGGKAVAKAAYNGVVWTGEKTWDGMKWTGGQAVDGLNAAENLISDLNPFDW